MTHLQSVQKIISMKEIDEIAPFNLNKLFETPQKKDKTIKKSSDLKAVSPSPLGARHKFDLGESPRFKVSGDMRIDQQQSSGKQQHLESVKKSSSPPILAKFEESPYSSIDKLISERRHKENLRESFGHLRINKNRNQCYSKLIKQMEQGFSIEVPLPEIIDSDYQDENIYSQVVNFSLNAKNSRKLIYDCEKQTLVSVYECLGCGIEFDNSPALGGHLRSCQHKEIHYKTLEKYLKSSEGGQIQQESDDFMGCDAYGFKRPEIVKKEVFKTPQKSVKIQDEKINRMTEKQKQNSSVFYSSEKSVSKSIIWSQKPFDDIDHGKIQSEQDEGYQEGSEEYYPSEEKTVKKQKGINRESKRIRGKGRSKN